MEIEFDTELMKTKFYQKINLIIVNKSSNSSFLSKEKYEFHVQQITELKRGERRKEPKDYQLMKRYDVVRNGNLEKLIYPVAEGKFVVCVNIVVQHSRKNFLC